MAQFVSVDIDIEGESVKQFSSLALSQSIFEHHSFRVVCPTEAIDGLSGGRVCSAKDMIGKSITIKINAVGGSSKSEFSGVITQVEAVRHSGHAGDVVLSGLSQTILLDNGVHCKTWEKQPIKNIAQDVLTHFQKNLLNPKVAPSFSDTLPYTVQYKETAWQFLCRLSATYGEWFFYDGRNLTLGPPQGATVQLVYGSDLHSFNMAVQVRPRQVSNDGVRLHQSEVYSSEPSGVADKAGLNDMGKLALQKSQQFYGTEPKQWVNQYVTSKKQLDDQANTRAAMQGSNLVRFNGSSGQPGIQVGGVVSVQGKNVFDQSDETFGSHTVISIHHHCDGQGNYSNDFVAIPSSVKMPPVTVRTEPYCETQSALVTDNNDPKGLGRIRVQFFWMSSTEKSPWLRVASPHGGDGKGMFFLPEVGEEVVTGFEGDSAQKPYVIGTVYHGKAKTTFGNRGNDVKALQTRSGNLIVMKTIRTEVFISPSAKGTTYLVDGGGNIKVTASESISFNLPKRGESN